jgi:hypothetical protein
MLPLFVAVDDRPAHDADTARVRAVSGTRDRVYLHEAARDPR